MADAAGEVQAAGAVVWRVRDGGIWLRSRDNRNGVLLVTGGAGGTGTGLYWHVVQDGSYGPALNPSASGLFNTGDTIHLRVEVHGNQYAVASLGKVITSQVCTLPACHWCWEVASLRVRSTIQSPLLL